ncbi:protein STICHEL-like 2 [Salvia miltiorrhiza]|uniref:protein STICHEL-like 2 n=1 Tax=Salvia miltiorrhiza TaxID=226208 RepID=UPI0025AC0C6C|nr:protein STICHEL-like 2 [Salvia miltiorrhiza]
MDGRRHSVDLPISRTLFALRRVRSLRDPSTTTSMSRLSALVDTLSWETRLSNAAVLGFENGLDDGNVSGLRSSSLRDCDLEDVLQLQSESLRSSCARPRRRLRHVDKACRGKSKCGSSRNRKHRVRGGDVLSSASDASMEGLSGGGRDRDRDRAVRPLLLSTEEEGTGCQQNGVGIEPCLETPRSLCQKFMPRSFQELVGQNVVVRSLVSAVSSERIASLYLFHGPRGTGKTSSARVFAAALNCLSPEVEKPCGSCRGCASVFSGRSSDVREVEISKINKISRFRSLVEDLDAPPVASRFKVYIVDDCHLLRGEAWAALLELPLPAHVVFIVVAPDLDELPSSIVSKAKCCSFQMVKVADIVSRLRGICDEEGVEIDEEALSFIAAKANGSVRDAETTLDQLSLLAKKITMPLVYEVNGVVSDGELLDLLCLALSSDASNTIRKVRELIASRIDPLQLVSQLAGLIADVLAGKGGGEVERKLFRFHKSGAELEQLRHALKILSETEKQLRTSKNQATWLTVALLQLSSAGASHDEDAPRLSTKPLQAQEGEESRRMSTDECWKHPVTSSCAQYEVETLELIWIRATRICESTSVKNFLQKRGKLVSCRLIQGVAMADLEFDHPDHVSRAEKSWKVIAGVLQRVLGYNVELRINLASNASKLRKPSLNLFGCSSRVHLCAECGSSASEYSARGFPAGDGYVQTCSLDCEPCALHACCHGNEVVSSIRSSDGNALSVGIRTPHKSLLDGVDGGNPSSSNGVVDGIENRSRRSESWKLLCWRTVTFPFRKAQTLLEKKLC